MKVLSKVSVSMWELLQVRSSASVSPCLISHGFPYVDKDHGTREPCCSQPLVTFGRWKHLGAQGLPVM